MRRNSLAIMTLETENVNKSSQHLYIYAWKPQWSEADSQSTVFLHLSGFFSVFSYIFFSHGRPEMGNEIESPSLYLQNLEHDLVDGKAFFGSGPVPSRYLQRQTAAVTFSSPTAVR